MLTFRKSVITCAALSAALLLASGCDKKQEHHKPDFTSNLISHFPFSGNGVDAVSGIEHATPGITFLSDRKGDQASAAFFNGFSGWMNVPAHVKEKEGTISFWIFPCLCKENNPLFVMKSVESDPAFGQYYIGYSEEGRIEAICQGKWNVETDIAIEANKWYHLVVRWNDDTGLIDIFVNGKKKLSEPYSVDASKLPGSTSPTFLGKILNKSKDGGSIQTVYYKGKLDDVRLYNIALPYEEIEALYKE